MPPTEDEHGDDEEHERDQHGDVALQTLLELCPVDLASAPLTDNSHSEAMLGKTDGCLRVATTNPLAGLHPTPNLAADLDFSPTAVAIGHSPGISPAPSIVHREPIRATLPRANSWS